MPVPFRVRIKVPRKWVLLGVSESGASLAVANRFNCFRIWFPFTPVTIHSVTVNTHVKCYLGIFKCLTTISFVPLCKSDKDL